MSHASLKEQLLSLGVTCPAVEKPRQKKKSHHQPEKSKEVKSHPKPAWLERAQYGVELLKAHFPACFKEMKEIQPLKVGLKQDLVKQLSSRNDIAIDDKACMVSSLAYYVNSLAYHKRVIEGAPRIDLLGNASGMVTAEEARYSEECCLAKAQKKKPAEKFLQSKSQQA